MSKSRLNAKFAVRFPAAILLLSFVLSPSIAVAQREPLPGTVLPTGVELPRPGSPLVFVQERMPKPEELASCFDTYRWGSVPAIVEPALTQASQGSTLSFTGVLRNENPYPIPNVEVWAKIFHIRSEGKDVNGPDVVAWIKASDALDLAAEGEKALSFSWDVPADAEPGDYQVATFVTSSERFELAGLSFTDDVVGNTANFEVTGQDVGVVRFEKDSVRVNGRPYFFAAFPPDIPQGAPRVPVELSVANTTDAPYEGTITWRLHSWDRLSQRTLITETTDVVQVHPNASSVVSYIVEDDAHTVYYLVGTLESSLGSESIVGIRFVRNGVNTPRFNFVTGTPANGGAAIACIHSTGEGSSEDSRVELVARRPGPLADLFGFFGFGQLAAATYEGPISADIYALAAPLSEPADDYVVEARLYKDGSLVDEVRVPYCAEGECPSPIAGYIVLTLISLIAAAALILMARRFRSARTPAAMPTI